MTAKFLFLDTKTLSRQYFCVGCLLFLLAYGSIFFAKQYLAPDGGAYLKFREMRGTICVFFGIIPMAFVGLGYGVMPLHNGSKMYFPLLDPVSLALFYLSVILMLIGVLAPGRFFFLLALFTNIAFAIFCSVNFIATISHFCKAGGRWTRMRSVVWTLFATAILVFFNFLLLEFGAGLQLTGSFLGSNFFAAPLVTIQDQPVPDLRKHLFWFLGHPEVYILLLLLVGLLLDGLRRLSRRTKLTQ